MDDIKIHLVLAQFINFALLLSIFYYFLGDKIVKAIEERRKVLKSSEEAEDIAQQKLEEAEAEKEQIIKDARLKASEIEKNAEELAKQNRQKTLEKSEKEAEYIVDSARTQIEKEQKEMENSMKSRILGLALKLNSKVFWKESANKDFMEKEYDLLVK